MKRAAAAAGLFFLLLVQILWAGPPKKINVQGELTNSSTGEPSNSQNDVNLRIYSSQLPGVVLYQEVQHGISFSNGLFNLILGDSGDIPDTVWNYSPLEIGISINADPEMTPRIRLISVPYAVRATGVSGHLETQPGSLRIPNLGSSGQDGVAFVATDDSSRLSIGNIGSSGQDGVSIGYTYAKRSAITATQQNEAAAMRHTVQMSADSGSGAALELSSRLNGLPPGTPVIGTLTLATNDSTASVAIGDLDGDGLVDVVTTNDRTKLSLSNIGSSGEDGVSIATHNGDSATFKVFNTNDPGDVSPRRVTVKVTPFDAEMGIRALDSDLRASAGPSRSELLMSSRLNGLPPGTPVIGTLTMTTNDSMASLSIGDPDFDLLRIKMDSTGGSLSIGDPDFDLLRIVGGKTEGLVTMTGDPDFDLLRMSADADSAKIRMSGQVMGDPDFDILNINGGSTGGLISIRDTDTDPDDGVVIMATNSSGARVGIGTETPSQALHVIGNLCATGTIGACSDGRFKDHVETIGDALAVIEKLRGVDFDWKRSEFSDHQFADGKQLGFVAQEVKDVLPMLVSQGSDGYFSVDYGRLTPVLVEAVKQQQKIIDGQKGELSAVKTRLDELRNLVSKLLNEKTSTTTDR